MNQRTHRRLAPCYTPTHLVNPAVPDTPALRLSARGVSFSAMVAGLHALRQII